MVICIQFVPSSREFAAFLKLTHCKCIRSWLNKKICQFVPISVKVYVLRTYGVNVYQKWRQKINVKISESCSERKSAIWVFYNLLVTRAQKMMVSEAAFLSSDVAFLIRISSESI